jgi:starch synthase
LRILFATAELAPFAQVGGLGQAAAGLVGALVELGVEVEVALPDYHALPLEDEHQLELDVGRWAAPALVRTAELRPGLRLSLVRVPGIERPHPYTQPSGAGWPDNENRFFSFSAAAAALARARQPDVLHLNDWHTATALAHLEVPPPTVLTIHTVGYQGGTNAGWLAGFPHHQSAFAFQGYLNPLVGGIRLAHLVVTVSPTYAQEIVTPAGGFGIDEVLRRARHKLVGIRNGIDASIWDPSADPNLAATYGPDDLGGKERCRRALRQELELPQVDAPLVVMVSRLVAQKGVDLVLPVVPFLDSLPAQLAVLGDGDADTAAALMAASALHPDTVAFRRGYDDALGHRLFAAGDLLLMPSRFEPCGLAQMQAMRYGTVPVVTDVGGLHDTVVDLDAHPEHGTGIVAREVSPLGVLDGLHRAARAHAGRVRFGAARARGMSVDWSWHEPALAHLDHYRRLTGQRPTARPAEERAG